MPRVCWAGLFQFVVSSGSMIKKGGGAGDLGGFTVVPKMFVVDLGQFKVFGMDPPVVLWGWY